MKSCLKSAINIVYNKNLCVKYFLVINCEFENPILLKIFVIDTKILFYMLFEKIKNRQQSKTNSNYRRTSKRELQSF
jgi:hypothetical protein